MDRAIFFDHVRAQPFGGRLTPRQVGGCNAILDAFERHAPSADPRFVAYALATAFHETARTMQPICEYGKGHGRAYGVPAGPAHQIYFGRGYVQLTWWKNYATATARLRQKGVIGADVDLVKNPDLALRPDVAAGILVFGMLEGWFTGRKLADYFAGTRSDWVDARRIINGSDRAAQIAGYALHFYHALGVANAAAPTPGVPVAPKAAKAKAAAPKVSRTIVKAAGKRRRVA